MGQTVGRLSAIGLCFLGQAWPRSPFQKTYIYSRGQREKLVSGTYPQSLVTFGMDRSFNVTSPSPDCFRPPKSETTSHAMQVCNHVVFYVVLYIRYHHLCACFPTVGAKGAGDTTRSLSIVFQKMASHMMTTSNSRTRSLESPPR